MAIVLPAGWCADGECRAQQGEFNDTRRLSTTFAAPCGASRLDGPRTVFVFVVVVVVVLAAADQTGRPNRPNRSNESPESIGANILGKSARTRAFPFPGLRLFLPLQFDSVIFGKTCNDQRSSHLFPQFQFLVILRTFSLSSSTTRAYAIVGDRFSLATRSKEQEASKPGTG